MKRALLLDLFLNVKFLILVFWLISARSLQRRTLCFLFYFYAFLMKPFRWPEATDGNCIYDNEKSLRMYICLKIQNHKVDKQLLSCALTLMFYGLFFFSVFFYYRSNLKDIFPFSDNLVRLVNNLMFRISMQIEFTINKSRCQADGKILASSASATELCTKAKNGDRGWVSCPGAELHVWSFVPRSKMKPHGLKSLNDCSLSGQRQFTIIFKYAFCNCFESPTGLTTAQVNLT